MTATLDTAAATHDATATGSRSADRIRKQLEQAIVQGTQAPGERLDETRLSEDFGVSRTPVREALFQLVASGLAEHRRNRGVFVRHFDVRELYERFEVMAELGALCGRLAARRMTPATLVQLNQRVEACGQALRSSDSDHYYRENERLHDSLYVASGNAYLAEQAIALHNRLQPYRRLQLRLAQRMRQSMDEHRAVVEALARGDEDTVANLLREHVAIQGEKFHNLMAHR